MRNLLLISLLFLVALCGPALAAYPTDAEFLDKVQQDTLRYFLDEQEPSSGLIRDSSRAGSPSSVAACGFGLVAFCIGAERGWISREDAYRRASLMLRTFRDKVENARGFFYHFVNVRDGRRVWSSEASSIDTAIFLAGALFAGEYFKGTQVEKIAGGLYREARWDWMLDKDGNVRMGYNPENGFLPYSWNFYSEHLLLLALAIGSPSYPAPKESWDVWCREYANYGQYEFVHSFSGGLFTYQYPHAFIDFRGLLDGNIDYWENSRNAILANRQYCIDQSEKFKTYCKDCWGLTASTGPGGYKDYGAIPGRGLNDGTIAPSGVCGSLPFAPDVTTRAMRFMYDVYGDRIYGEYGFVDSFNLDRNWFSKEYLGVSQGISLLMMENYRTGFVWKYFMRLEPIKKWTALCMEKKV